jgi:glyoxylase-like metal-dependent hydrolase (beta-lactamase superfamily II)
MPPLRRPEDTMPETLQSVTQFPKTAVLTPKVHRILGMNPSTFTGPGTNTYVIGLDGDAPLLLDTGAGVPEWAHLLKTHLDGVKAPPLARAIMTHGHSDHIGGAPDFMRLFPRASLHKKAWPERDATVKARFMPLEDGARVTGAGFTLRAVHSPGHAPDHLCFLLEEEKALFTGDVVLGVGTTVIPLDGGDLGQYLDTLRRLLTLDVRRIYPGHGPVIENAKAKIQQYLDHRLERERQILAELSAGPKTIPAMVRSIYREYPENLYAAAGQSVESHLIKLEREGRVARDAAGKEPHFTLLQ